MVAVNPFWHRYLKTPIGSSVRRQSGNSRRRERVRVSFPFGNSINSADELGEGGLVWSTEGFSEFYSTESKGWRRSIDLLAQLTLRTT